MAAAADKKLVKSKSGLKIVSLCDEIGSPFTLKEPVWVADTECKECMNCKAKFDFINRRHHCRRCGQCFCAGCCNNKLSLHRMCFVDPVRHCKKCLQLSLSEADFFEKQIKVLHKGCDFALTTSALQENREIVYTSKLSTDERFLLFETNENEESLDPIELMLIDCFQIENAIKDQQGNLQEAEVNIKYKDSCGELQEMQLKSAGPTTQRQTMQWIIAIHKAMKLLMEKKNANAN